jgi:hypothetical protein
MSEIWKGLVNMMRIVEAALTRGSGGVCGNARKKLSKLSFFIHDEIMHLELNW